MNKKSVLAAGILGLLIFFALPLFAEAKGIYTRLADGRIEYLNEDRIMLTSADALEEQKLDLDGFNPGPPWECLTQLTACEETTEIVVTTRKVWTPIKLEPITSSELDSETFAKYFPDLKSEKRIDASSPRDERMIAQRILYEVGLLPVEPTGKFGFLTELATLKLQCAAGFEEFADNGKAIMGEQTVAKLKELKLRLADPAAIAARPVPNRDFATCSQPIQDRANQIYDLIEQVATGQISGGTFPLQSTGPAVAIPQPNFLNLEGEVTIKKN